MQNPLAQSVATLQVWPEAHFFTVQVVPVGTPSLGHAAHTPPQSLAVSRNMSKRSVKQCTDAASRETLTTLADAGHPQNTPHHAVARTGRPP
jgi:hypothetical protein